MILVHDDSLWFMNRAIWNAMSDVAPVRLQKKRRHCETALALDFLCISHLSNVPFDLFYPNGWAGKDSAHKVNTSRSLTASRAYGCYSAPCVGCRVGGWMFMTLIEIAFWCFLIDATQHCPGKSDSLADLWSLFKPQSLTAYERGLSSPVESDHQGPANRQTCKV